MMLTMIKFLPWLLVFNAMTLTAKPCDFRETFNSVEAAHVDVALNFLRQTVAKNPNKSTLLSPIAATVALAMLYVGSSGKTRAELDRFFNGANDAAELDVPQHFGRVFRELNAAPSTHLRFAAKLFVQSDLSVSANYRSLIAQHFLSHLQPVNFRRSVSAVQVIINDYVRAKTIGKIGNVMSPQYQFDNGNNRFFELVLVNAIYLRSDWAERFDPKDTRTEPFTAAGGLKRQLSMMHRSGQFDYYENERVQMVALPFSDQKFTMYVVLPRYTTVVNETLQTMSSAKLLSYIEDMELCDVEVVLPKFRVDARHNMASLLASVGVTQLFADDAADLSGVTSDKRLAVDKLPQRAYLEIEESGGGGGSAAVPPPRPLPAGCLPYRRICAERRKFVADHSFLFLVMSAPDHHILVNGLFTGNNF